MHLILANAPPPLKSHGGVFIGGLAPKNAGGKPHEGGWGFRLWDSHHLVEYMPAMESTQSQRCDSGVQCRLELNSEFNSTSIALQRYHSGLWVILHKKVPGVEHNSTLPGTELL